MRGRADPSRFSTRRHSGSVCAASGRRRASVDGAIQLAAVGIALSLAACAAAPPVAQPPLTDPASSAQQFLQRRLDSSTLGLAADPQQWRLQDWRHAARQLNPQILARQAELETALAARATAAQAPNPDLHLSLERVLNTGSLAWLYGAALEFLLRPDGEAERLQQLAAIDALSMQAQLAQTQAEVDTELQRALLDLHAATRMQALLQRQTALRQRLLDAARQRSAAGDIDKVGLLPVLTRLADAKAMSAAAREAGEDARARLAAAVGVPQAALSALTELIADEAPALPPAVDDATRLRALVRHPLVQQALQHYARAELELQGQLAQTRPGWRLAPGYQWDRGDRILTLDASLELPLFHRNQAGIAEAMARRRSAAQNLAAAQAALYQRIERAQTALQAAQRAQAEADAGYQHAQAALAVMQRRLQLGAATRPAVLAHEDELIATALHRIRARQRLQLAQAQLQDVLYARPPLETIRQENPQ